MVHDHGEYAHVSLRLHPGEAGSGYSFEDTTIGGAIPRRFMTSIEGGIRESMANGVLNGYHVLPFSYRHLSPLVGSTRAQPKGAEEGDEHTTPPRPPLKSGICAVDARADVHVEVRA